jgi:hypothetical protein
MKKCQAAVLQRKLFKWYEIGQYSVWQARAISF